MALFGLLFQGAFAQQANSEYNQQEAFAPDFYTQQGNMFRSADGTPGPKYWQNRADYAINVTLDTAKKHVSGEVAITYTNNSPDQLPYVWLQLDQNIFREDSRAVAATKVTGGRYAAAKYTQGDEISKVTVKIGGKSYEPKYTITDTRMQIQLPEDLKAGGDKLNIQINYGFDVPEKGTDRMGRMATKNGWIYEIAQWFPRMCVYDDVVGWNTLPYLGAGEFYLDYGDIHYNITAPANLVIVGSGTLDNPEDVLTKSQIKKLKKAKGSDQTINIHSLADVKSGKDFLNKKELTWKFSCLNTRDVAWAASKAFIWDAVRIKMHSGKEILGQSVYPEEAASPQGWDSSAYYTKRSIELNSYWHDFPYPVATNVAGTVGGMEYPGIVFCSAKTSSNASLWFVTLHEFGHNWFPMLVGSNERKYAWMDEGINTFTNFYCSRIFHDGAYNNEPKKYMAAKRFFKEDAEPPMTRPDVLDTRNLADAGYYKPAVGLLILRDVILGPDRFDYAFKNYIKQWAYKHPTPDDFFRSMENGAGEDLGWFWKGWFYNNWAVDQAVTSVTYADNKAANGALITVENIGKMPLPVQLKIEEKNGKVTEMKLPVEIWQRGAKWTFLAKTTSAITKVTLDPNEQYPDVNPANNSWPNTASTAKAAPAGVTTNTIIDKYIKKIGGRSTLEKVKNATIIMEGDAGGTTLKFEHYLKAPDKFLEKITLPAMKMEVLKMLVEGDKGTVSSQGKVTTLTGDSLNAIKEQLHLFPELYFSKKGYQSELKGIIDVDGKSAYQIEVTSPMGRRSTQYYDVASGLKVKSTSDNGVIFFSDYRDVNGIQMPFTEKLINMGHEVVIKSKEINFEKPIDDTIFQ